MAPKRKSFRNNQQKKRIVSKSRGPLRARLTTSRNLQTSIPNTIRWLQMFRMILPALPIAKATSSIFDMLFNYVISALSNANYYTGAYGMFEITPASILYNSPLLAKTDGGYSFPGYPVSVKYLTMRIRNTTRRSEHSGKWAAVLIPYREEHDSKHYETLQSLTFDEMCSMPHAVNSTADKDLVLSYKMRNKIEYCARPREITEPIAVVMIQWDQRVRPDLTKQPTASDFTCEIEVKGGCVPHVLFGPRHRSSYDDKDFNIKAITKGIARVHDQEGNVTFQRLEDLEIPSLESLEME